MTGSSPSLRSNHRFRLLVAARFVSNLGNGLAPVALAFGVLSLPGASGTSLSLVAASRMVPIVVFLVIGGVVADRVGRARMVGGTDLIGSVVIAVNGVLFIIGHASVVQLCITGFAFGVLNALWYPAFSGLLPDVVDAEQLQRANSLVGFSANIGFTVGASAAGVVVNSFGPGWAMLMDGGSFFIAGLLVWQLRSATLPGASSASIPPMLMQLKEGWREFRTRRWLVVIAASFSLINMCFEAFLAVLAPLQAKQELSGPRSLSLMMSAWGLGSIVGVIFSMRVRARRPLVTAMAVMPVMGLWMLALSVPVHMLVIMALAFATGIAIDIFYVLWMTTMQTRVPAEALSRVGSFDAFGSNLLAPIGLLIAGPLTSVFGVRSILVGAALVTVALSVAALMSTDVRRVTNEGSAESLP